MLFAATVRHAEEVMASLPPDLSAMITGDTPKGERASIIARFKARRIKYLVNVAVLTTGFDAPHVDVIAILRKTESVGLLQQIIGRGLRLHDDKRDCLVLDYAGPGYDAACRAWAERAEAACTGLSPERAARCRAIFRACSEHELHFREMCATPRTDV